MNDRVKTVILLLLVFGVFGIVGWRISSSNDSGAKPVASEPVPLDNSVHRASESSAAMQDAPSASAATNTPIKKAVQVASLPSPPPVASENPFRTPTGPSVAAVPVQSPQPVRAADNSQAFNPMKGDILPGADGQVEIKPETPTYRVMGVVTGEKSVVILRVGDHDMVLTVGDYFGDMYQIKAITTTQVVIQMGRNVKILPVMGF